MKAVFGAVPVHSVPPTEGQTVFRCSMISVIQGHSIGFVSIQKGSAAPAFSQHFFEKKLADPGRTPKCNQNTHIRVFEEWLCPAMD